MSVHLHIERLVVDGLPLSQHEAERMQAALEAELVQLLVGGIGPILPASVAHGRNTTVVWQPHEGPAILGKRSWESSCSSSLSPTRSGARCLRRWRRAYSRTDSIHECRSVWCSGISPARPVRSRIRLGPSRTR